MGRFEVDDVAQQDLGFLQLVAPDDDGLEGQRALAQAGDLLLLLRALLVVPRALGGDVDGVTTEGLAFPLHDETLFLGRARGVSNAFTSSHARITLRRGDERILRG